MLRLIMGYKLSDHTCMSLKCPLREMCAHKCGIKVFVWCIENDLHKFHQERAALLCSAAFTV